MKKFTAKQNSTLKKFTDESYPQGSFYFAALIKRGDIKVNGARCRADRPVCEGDEIVYYTTPAEEAKPSHAVVYEDENVIVCDKFSGVNSEALFCQLQDVAPYPVHRLDRNTQGLIILAKTQAAESELAAAFKGRRVQKIYYCFAVNAFKKRAGRLEGYLIKDGQAAEVKVTNTPRRGAAKIVTDYEVVEEHSDYALVKVILHTGKTHQIRAHLASIGCPVLGDTRYGDAKLNAKYKVTRQILVCKRLVFYVGGALAYLNGRAFESALSPTLPDGGDTAK